MSCEQGHSEEQVFIVCKRERANIRRYLRESRAGEKEADQPGPGLENGVRKNMGEEEEEWLRGGACERSGLGV